MGISGSWKAKTQNPYANERKWGSGWNAVHASHNAGVGRGLAVHETVRTVDDATVDFAPDGYGYCDEDTASALWGGMAMLQVDHPNLGGESGRGSAGDFPSYGPRRAGVPGGVGIRAVNRGADATVTAKETQPSGLSSGEAYKRFGAVLDAEVSDMSTVLVQTSMTQRDTAREGSQVAPGRANAPRSRISSRIPGMKVPTYQGGYRHAEMTPVRQDTILRPFQTRTAATGNPDRLRPNAAYESVPRRRQPTQPPEMGTDTNSGIPGGYTAEDVIPYV